MEKIESYQELKKQRESLEQAAKELTKLKIEISVTHKSITLRKFRKNSKAFRTAKECKPLQEA